MLANYSYAVTTRLLLRHGLLLLIGELLTVPPFAVLSFHCLQKSFCMSKVPAAAARAEATGAAWHQDRQTIGDRICRRVGTAVGHELVSAQILVGECFAACGSGGKWFGFVVVSLDHLRRVDGDM